MQLISCAPQLRIDIRHGKVNYTPKGDVASTDEPLFIQFSRAGGGSVPAHARELLAQLPGFGTGIGRDEDPYETRVGWWDSMVAQYELGWSDEDRKFVEDRILRIGDPNIMVVEEPRVAAPYDRFDTHRVVHGKRTIDHVIADITQTFELAGFDVEQAVAYERQNGNDQRVIDALYGLAATAAETEEVVTA